MEKKRKLRQEIALTLALILFSTIATALGFEDATRVLVAKLERGDVGDLLKQGLFLFIVAFLVYGGFVYQFCRLMYLRRRRDHNPATENEQVELLSSAAPPVTILVPSYREEQSVIFQTLFSACAQDYPNKRVVLLIDDPPKPRRELDRLELEQSRKLPLRLMHMYKRMFDKFETERGFALDRMNEGGSLVLELDELAKLHGQAAAWYRARSNEYRAANNSDIFFIDKVLMTLARDLDEKGRQLLEQSHRFGPAMRRQVVEKGYARLLGHFAVEITSFERKTHEQLSHEPNKAMNLNSYIGWIGTKVPDAKYVVTLDADSILLPGYVTKLVSEMEKPECSDIAVIQTPYSAFPRSKSLIERIAGATTDIQYIIHQGFTHFNATYWVGANAVLRMQALREIEETFEERGHVMKRFIQDRTVIEDTESTIDLVRRGWRLHNHPERLAYSATPPDFGALTIQRRRWANGGLLIFPKLLGHIFSRNRKNTNFARHVAEALVRSHYLLSITFVNLGLLIMLGFSFEDCVTTSWLPLTAIPYYFLYARDLSLNGYRFIDIVNVYALNLVLVPVNLGGVFKSLHQGFTGKRTPFARTPKVVGRTSAPWTFLMLEFALLGSWTMGAFFCFYKGHFVSGSFAFAHALLLMYGVSRFIGFKEAAEDVRLGFRESRMIATKEAA